MPAWYDQRDLIRSVVIESGVTSLGDHAFLSCSNLTHVTIPNTVTRIGLSCFSYCKSLTSITVPASVTSIEKAAFAGCSSLESMTLPFVGDSRKTSSDTYQYPFGYIFGNSSDSGSYSAEQNYYGYKSDFKTSEKYMIPSSLKSVTITDGDILYGAFSNCKSLTSITIPEDTTTIGARAFAGTSLETFHFPDNVVSIGDGAFSGSMLKTITIPESLTSIGDAAFGSCSYLTEITIPDGVTNLGARAFRNCTKLENITLSGNTTEIGDEAFSECTSLKKITIPGSAKRIGEKAFWKCTSLTDITIQYGVTRIENDAFYGCTSLTSIVVPDSVTYIGGAFDGCAGLTHMTLPFVGGFSQVAADDTEQSTFGFIFGVLSYTGTSATKQTFSSETIMLTTRTYYIPTRLKSVTITGGDIVRGAFMNCKNLTSITIGDGITTIGASAFSCCEGLTSITVPASVTSVRAYAFNICSDLEEIHFKGSAPNFGDQVFNGVYDLVAYYPAGDPSWTEEVRQNYGGTVTWIAVCDHEYSTDWSRDEISHYHACTICGDCQDLAEHTFSNVCDELCDICGFTRETTHSWDAGTVTRQPTCGAEGEKIYTCSICADTRIETIERTTGHTYDHDCDTDCNVCGLKRERSHNWNSGTVTQKPTCKEEGTKTFTCTVCGGTKVETVEKSAIHTYDHDCDTACNICGEVRTVNHSYATTWSADKSGHWYECSICGIQKEIAGHTPGTEATESTAQTCTVCGYIIRPVLNHEHSYNTEWGYDRNGHWHACGGCSEQKDYAAHSFENACDTVCDTCGYQRQTSHTFSEQWSSDKENHWHACTECGEQTDIETHAPGAAATEITAQTCTICKYELSPALGTGETEEPSHPADGTEPDSTVPTPTQPEVDEPEEGFSWWIIFVLLGSIGGIIVVVVLKKKKK